jgi:hypothetical protein
MKRTRRTTRERTRQRSADRHAASSEDEQRQCNDVFLFFRVCDNAACRRNRSCSGEPAGCFERHWSRFSEAQKVWLRAGLEARQQGQSVAEANATAEAEVLRWHNEQARYAPPAPVQPPARETPAPVMPRIRVL